MLSVLALIAVHQSGQPLYNELAVDTTILPVVFTGYAALRMLWPAEHLLPPERAVAQVCEGQDVVGSAFHVRGRLMVTSARVVNLALNRPATEAAPPHEHVRVMLRFPSASGPPRTVSALILEWGPSRRDLTGNDVVVLRTIERLRHIPNLRISAKAYHGDARIVLSHDDTSAGPAGSELNVRLVDHQLIAPSVRPALSATAAPIMSVDLREPEVTGDVVALLGPDITGGQTDSIRGRPPRLVEGVNVRAALRPVGRREVLRAGALLGGVAVLGGAGPLVLTQRPTARAGTPTTLRGAGWNELFEDPQVQRYLAGKNFTVGSFEKLSGLETVEPGRDLSTFDFVTAPNQAIANQLSELPRNGPRLTRPQVICSEDMVIVARRAVVERLATIGMIVQPKPGIASEGQPPRAPATSLDIRTYLETQREGLQWVDIDATDMPFPEDPIRIGHSDPVSAGGGYMFLGLLADVLGTLPGRIPPRWLWSEGPLSGSTAKATKDLLRDLERGDEQMVFAYEHDAISLLLKNPGYAEQYMILATHPTVHVQQMIMSTNRKFANLFAAPDAALARILSQQLHIRMGSDDKEINRQRSQLRQAAGTDRIAVQRLPSHSKSISPTPAELQVLVDQMIEDAGGAR